MAGDRGNSPEEAVDGFVKRLNAGDLEGVASCLARRGCLVTPDRTVIHGREDLRGAFAQLIACGFAAVLDLRTAVTMGEVAIFSDRWTTSMGTAGSSTTRRVARGTVLVSFLEGRWKLSLVAPWGWADEPLGL
ncbi:MAG: YybH family protein [Solirubrobacterales bacterium]